MKVLIVNLDKSVFEKKSDNRKRLEEYSHLVDKLFVIVFTTAKKEPIVFNDKLFIYPTNSRSRWLYIFDAIKIGRRIIRNSRGKILVTSQDPFETGLAGWLIAKFVPGGNLPLQLQIHTDFLAPYFSKESPLNRIRVLMAKFLIPRANCLRVVSKRIADSLAGFAKITVLPIFIDTEKIKNAPVKTDLRQKYPQFDFIILMASRLTKEKNIGMAIEAMEKVAKEYPKTGLIIVGDGPEHEALESRIKSAAADELSNNIVIENWNDDLASYYKTADLFLLTSNYEGYGRTFVEAMAAECKVISSDVGVADEILPKENIFEVNSKEQLKEKIIKAIKGEIKMSKAELLTKMPTKEEYLQAYKKSWESCAS